MSGSIEKAKEVDMLEILEKLQIPYKKDSGHVKIICPFHEERSPSCAVYPDHYFCYGCQAHGDGIDFVQKVVDVPFVVAVKMLNSI